MACYMDGWDSETGKDKEKAGHFGGIEGDWIGGKNHQYLVLYSWLLKLMVKFH